MSYEPIDSWIEKAAQDEKCGLGNVDSSEINVVSRRHKPAEGNIIVDLAEKIRPMLIKMFEGVRDEDGILVQPARVRGIALNLAQRLVKEHLH